MFKLKLALPLCDGLPFVNDRVHGILEREAAQDRLKIGVASGLSDLRQLDEADKVMALDAGAHLRVAAQVLNPLVIQRFAHFGILSQPAPHGAIRPENEKSREVGSGAHVKGIDLRGECSEGAPIHLLAEFIQPRNGLRLDSIASLRDGSGAFHPLKISHESQTCRGSPEEEARGESTDGDTLPACKAAHEPQNSQPGQKMDRPLAENKGEKSGSGRNEKQTVCLHLGADRTEHIRPMGEHEPSYENGSQQTDHPENLPHDASCESEACSEGDKSSTARSRPRSRRDFLQEIQK